MLTQQMDPSVGNSGVSGWMREGQREIQAMQQRYPPSHVRDTISRNAREMKWIRSPKLASSFLHVPKIRVLNYHCTCNLRNQNY